MATLKTEFKLLLAKTKMQTNRQQRWKLTHTREHPHGKGNNEAPCKVPVNAQYNMLSRKEGITIGEL